MDKDQAVDKAIKDIRRQRREAEAEEYERQTTPLGSGMAEGARQQIISRKAQQEQQLRDLDVELNGASRERGYQKPNRY